MGLGPAGGALAAVLAALLGAHAVLLLGVARRLGWTRALAALLLPPLAPFWGWQAGLRRTSFVWGAALAAYTLALVSVAFTTGR